MKQEAVSCTRLFYRDFHEYYIVANTMLPNMVRILALELLSRQRTEDMKTNRQLSLDVIRAVAILSIIFFHYNESIKMIVSPDLVFPSWYGFYGTIGVSFFVMLSGASLSISNTNNVNAFVFYKKRFLSLMPLFYVTYLFVILLYSVILQKPPFLGKQPFSFFLTIVGLDGFLLYKINNYYLIGEWFLGFIIVMYLFFPAMYLLFKKNKYIVVLLSFIISCFSIYFYNLDMAISRFPTVRIFEFVVGMYFGKFLKNLTFNSNIIIVIFSFLCISFCMLLLTNFFVVTFILLGILCFIFINSLVSLFNETNLLNMRKFIYFLSKYSYGSFLFHHVFIDNLILHYKFNIYSKKISSLFFLVSLICIYSVSYILTNFTEYFLLSRNKKAI